MRTILIIALTALTFLSFGQTYNFKPGWKVGDSKTFVNSTNEKDYENGELQSDTTTTVDGSIKIKSENIEWGFP